MFYIVELGENIGTLSERLICSRYAADDLCAECVSGFFTTKDTYTFNSSSGIQNT